MNVLRCVEVFVLTVSLAFAQEVPREKPIVEDHPQPGGAVIDQTKMPARPPARTRAELEAEFKDMLSGASLMGTWQMTTGKEGASGEGELTPPRNETYVIQGATKISDEVWIITARIQFAEQDVNIPVPVRVVWAEDTPMITLSDFSIPMLGTYSCRVIFHHGYYSGIWYSTVKNYGGIMSGRIVKQPAAAKDQPEKVPAKDGEKPNP